MADDGIKRPIQRYAGPARAGVPCSVLMALLVSVSLLLLPRTLCCAIDPKPGTVLVNDLNLRAGPGRHHPVIKRLKKGAKLLVLAYEGDWVRVQDEEVTGFVMNLERFLAIQSPKTTERDKAQAERLHRQLAESMEQIAVISQNERAVIDELDQTDRQLNRTRQKVAQLNEELAAMDRQIRTLQNKVDDLTRRTERNERYVAGRLTALYKLRWLGTFPLLAASDSMLDFLVNKKNLERILRYDLVVMDRLAGDKERLNALLDQLAVMKMDKRTLSAALNDRIETLKDERAGRGRLLEEIRSQKALQLAAADSLKRSARNLDRTMAALGSKADSGESRPIQVKEKPFASLKGLLMMPVKGKIISFFGPYQDSRFNVTRFQSGIHIQADRGEPIRAVYSGRTLFSAWFKGFGNMLIIDHGDHYYTVYAHLEEPFKSQGDPVEAGEVIGTVGDTGSLNEAGLHFEIRHHDKPMNPLRWIKRG